MRKLFITLRKPWKVTSEGRQVFKPKGRGSCYCGSPSPFRVRNTTYDYQIGIIIMKLTLESPYGTYSAEIEGSDLQIDVLLGGLLVPVLLAQGYAYETLEDRFDMDGVMGAKIEYTIYNENGGDEL